MRINETAENFKYITKSGKVRFDISQETMTAICNAIYAQKIATDLITIYNYNTFKERDKASVWKAAKVLANIDTDSPCISYNQIRKLFNIHPMFDLRKKPQ